jgi:hypothetical protein
MRFSKISFEFFISCCAVKELKSNSKVLTLFFIAEFCALHTYIPSLLKRIVWWRKIRVTTRKEIQIAQTSWKAIAILLIVMKHFHLILLENKNILIICEEQTWSNCCFQDILADIFIWLDRVQQAQKEHTCQSIFLHIFW